MDRRPSRQQGMTLIGFLLMFVLIGFFALLALKLAPVYFEYYKILSTVKSLKNEDGVVDKTPKEIIDLLQKRWDINSIDRISARDSVRVEKHGGWLDIHLDYEVEEHLLANVSILVKFDDSVEIGG